MKKAKVLITAANGHTGFPAAKTLLELGFEVRAFVRNARNPHAQELQALGAELFTGNIEDIRDVRRALDGVKRAFFVPTAPNLLFQGETFATAAEQAGVEHVVLLTQWLSSSTHPSIYTKEHWLVDQAFQRLPTVKVTIVEPGLFAFAYFMGMEAIAQLGLFPDFGSNAPPSNEDIGAVAAHILKAPTEHEGKRYRITGREMLTSQQKAGILAKILGRPVKANRLPEKMMMKIFRAGGVLPIRDYSQVRYYIQEGAQGTFAIGGATSVVKDIVGREAEDFETIARRHVEQDPAAKRTMANKLRAIFNMMKMMLTPAPDLDRYEREMGFPQLKEMELSSKSEEWCQVHARPAPTESTPQVSRIAG
jgi:NAD(P)H dehydrogenase (quinone)